MTNHPTKSVFHFLCIHSVCTLFSLGFCLSPIFKSHRDLSYLLFCIKEVKEYNDRQICKDIINELCSSILATSHCHNDTQHWAEQRSPALYFYIHHMLRKSLRQNAKIIQFSPALPSKKVSKSNPMSAKRHDETAVPQIFHERDC